MSFLDRIRACNAHDLANFVPFVVAGVRVGWVKRGFAPALRAWPDAFRVEADAVALAPGLDTPDARTAAVDAALRDLARAGVVRGWRGEYYPVAAGFADPPLMLMERSAVPLFGVAAYGVHLNGWVRRPDGSVHLWVGRRSRTKETYPGQLDNLVAGGQPAGMGVWDNLMKECAEEASIPPALAARAVPVGAVSYCQETEEGLKPDTMFVYDLELPPDFAPRNADGEIEGFELWPVARAMATVAETTRFKFNCNLVNIDFFVRHGFLAPDRPDYPAIVRGLHR